MSDQVGVRDVLSAIRHGARRFRFVLGPDSSYESNVRGALATALERSVRRGLARLPGVTPAFERLTQQQLNPPSSTLDSVRSAVQASVAAAPTAPAVRSGPLHVAHYIGTLGSGGAERQLTILSEALQRAGHRVSVYVCSPLEEDLAHYAKGLLQDGVTVTYLPPLPHDRRPSQALQRAVPARLLSALDRHARRCDVLPLVEALLSDPPDVLHTWLDEPNTTGGVAGLVAGVPRVLISTWNVNPANFPRFDKPWFRDSYRLLGDSARVVFTANSRAGGDDYAAWSGLPAERVVVVPNGIPLEEWRPLTAEERRRGRAALGIDEDAFVVAGIFRLAPEKRPEDFFQVLLAARARLPGLRGLHIGTGPLEAEMRARAHDLGLDDVLHFVGRTTDPRAVLGLADVSLLTSEVEGSPNVSQESQGLGLPMLLTRVVGSPETIEEGETGFCFEVGDVTGMADRVTELASDLALCRRMGDRGNALVKEQFSVEAMLGRFLAAYRG